MITCPSLNWNCDQRSALSNRVYVFPRSPPEKKRAFLSTFAKHESFATILKSWLQWKVKILTFSLFFLSTLTGFSWYMYSGLSRRLKLMETRRVFILHGQKREEKSLVTNSQHVSSQLCPCVTIYILMTSLTFINTGTCVNITHVWSIFWPMGH